MTAKMTDEQLVDQLAEMYPGEIHGPGSAGIPSNEDILDWVTEIRDKANEIDNLIP